tara:strand:- start:1857 stop:2087 length:231 start_codon:yes stop_codon:yes gene_type:complete
VKISINQIKEYISNINLFDDFDQYYVKNNIIINFYLLYLLILLSHTYFLHKKINHNYLSNLIPYKVLMEGTNKNKN